MNYFLNYYTIYVAYIMSIFYVPRNEKFKLMFDIMSSVVCDM